MSESSLSLAGSTTVGAAGKRQTQVEAGAWIGVGCAFAMLVGLGLRFFRLGAQSLWFDEGYAWWVSSQPIPRLIEAIRYDFSPPGYFVMLAGWMRMFGDSEWAMRSLSALLGSAGVFLVYLIAKRVLGYGASLVLAVSLFALSAIQIEYSQESRAYITGSFLFAAALYALMRHLDGGGWRWLLGFAFLAAGLVYQHNVMWFFLAGLHVFWLVAPGEDGVPKRLRNILIADVVTALLYLPWLPGLLHQMSSIQGAYFTDRPVFYHFTFTTIWLGGAAPDWLKQLAGDLGIVDSKDRIVRLGSFALISVAVFGGLACARGRRRMLVAVLLAGLVPILLAMLYSQFRRSVYVHRAFIPASVVLPVVLASVWPLPVKSRFAKRLAGAMAILLVLVSATSCWGYFHYGAKENWRMAVQWLNSQPHEGSLVVFNGPEGQALYDYYTRWQGGKPMEATGAPGGFYEVDPPRAMRRVIADDDLDSLRKSLQTGAYRRVYLVQAYTLWADPEQRIPHLLAEQFHEGEGIPALGRSLGVRTYAIAAAP